MAQRTLWVSPDAFNNLRLYLMKRQMSHGEDPTMGIEGVDWLSQHLNPRQMASLDLYQDQLEVVVQSQWSGFDVELVPARSRHP